MAEDIDVLLGIHETKLQELSIEVLDYKDKISELFDKLDACMERLPNCYRGKPSEKLVEKYDEIKLNFPNVKASIKNCADDLSFLVLKMQENDKNWATIFQQSSIETNSEIANFNTESAIDTTNIKKGI
jgi:uncharacterized coiled-coil DUF342 family protein